MLYIGYTFTCHAHGSQIHVHMYIPLSGKIWLFKVGSKQPAVRRRSRVGNRVSDAHYNWTRLLGFCVQRLSDNATGLKDR